MENLMRQAISNCTVTRSLVHNLAVHNRTEFECNFHAILFAAAQQNDIDLVNLLFSISCDTIDRVAAHVIRITAFIKNEFMVNRIISWLDEQQRTVTLNISAYIWGLTSPSRVYLWLKTKALAENITILLADWRHYFSVPAIKSPKVVERIRDLGLGAELLQIAITNKWMGLIKEFEKDPLVVRKACLANSGAVLHRMWKNKPTIRTLLRMGVSCSDCASVGLLWTK